MLKSLNHNEKAYVRFINKTNRNVHVLWVNYKGEYVKYNTLGKDLYFDITTYKTHPWIAMDTVTKDRMHIGGKYVFFPVTSREFISKRYPNKYVPPDFETRIRVLITLPLYSLRYAAMLAIRDRLRVSDEVDELSLPKQLIQELKTTIELRNRQSEIAYSR